MARPRSVRIRLLAIALLPTLVILPVFFAITAWNWSDRFAQLLINKVNAELTIASEYLESLRETRSLRLEALAQSQALAQTRGANVAALLARERERLDLDFLFVAPRADQPKWPVVRAALGGATSTAIDVFDAADLRQVSEAFAARARIPLVPTRAAVPTDRKEETRGMVLHMATPLPSGDALVGGILLNRNLAFIDTINDLVFPAESLPDGSHGTATLFLEDVRVSTNVRLFQDERALGTRVSAAVRAAVLDEGQIWLDRAFVVNDWYISAYEPIVDSFGDRVGMLYVGFLEQPFATAWRNTVMGFAIGFAAIVALTIPLFLRWAAQIFRPLETTLATIDKVEAGDLQARTGVTRTGGEINAVASHLDGLLDQIAHRNQELRNWAEHLNSRVADRTAALEQANKNLEATTQQLIVSEKLASLGEIAAGLAHEINNPVAVIQGNLDLIRSELGSRATSHQTEFRLIEEQVQAINLLVSKILQFTRPDEFADFDEAHFVEEVADDTLPLINHLLGKAAITVEMDHGATRAIRVNRTEFQQVLINLMVNAIHAMPEGGTLRVMTRDAGSEVIVEISDTGNGMPEHVRARAFDPFFTTKLGGGTGLGLSITRKIIERYGGRIALSSAPGTGTQFRIWLPVADAAVA